jgi:hypothetical protein
MLSVKARVRILCKGLERATTIPATEQTEIGRPVLRANCSIFSPFVRGQATCIGSNDVDESPGMIHCAEASQECLADEGLMETFNERVARHPRSSHSFSIYLHVKSRSKPIIKAGGFQAALHGS